MASFLTDLQACLDIQGFGAPIKVSRALPSPVEKGRRTGRPEDFKFEVQASVQPLSDKELQQLPEGMRNQGTVWVFSDCELLTVSTSECRVPDRFECNGVTYQIQSVEDWSQTTGHYRCRATRIGQ